jgi:hypothetical protein
MALMALPSSTDDNRSHYLWHSSHHVRSHVAAFAYLQGTQGMPDDKPAPLLTLLPRQPRATSPQWASPSDSLPSPLALVPLCPHKPHRLRTRPGHPGNARQQTGTPADAATAPAACHVTPAGQSLRLPLITSGTRPPASAPTSPPSHTSKAPRECQATNLHPCRHRYHASRVPRHTSVAGSPTTSSTRPTAFGTVLLPPHMPTEPTRPNAMQPMVPALRHRPHSYSDGCHVNVAAPDIRTFCRIHARAIALVQVHGGTPADAATVPAACHVTPAWRMKTKPPRQLNALRPHLRATGCVYLSRQPLTLHLPPRALVPSSFCTALSRAATLPPPSLAPVPPQRTRSPSNTTTLFVACHVAHWTAASSTSGSLPTVAGLHCCLSATMNLAPLLAPTHDCHATHVAQHDGVFWRLVVLLVSSVGLIWRRRRGV